MDKNDHPTTPQWHTCPRCLSARVEQEPNPGAIAALSGLGGAGCLLWCPIVWIFIPIFVLLGLAGLIVAPGARKNIYLHCKDCEHRWTVPKQTP